MNPKFKTARDLLGKALGKHQDNIILACSFSEEDITLAHMGRSLRENFRIFAIDTGRLHEETLDCALRLESSLGIRIEWFFPKFEILEELQTSQGPFFFRNSVEERHQCCHHRKVEPLQRALKGKSAWITGMRRNQGVTRTKLAEVQIDNINDGIEKYNPLADWNSEEVMEYVQQYKLPINQLLNKGYASIGCAPCTRPVAPNADPRSGRWWWESPEHRECGLHVDHSQPSQES